MKASRFHIHLHLLLAVLVAIVVTPSYSQDYERSPSKMPSVDEVKSKIHDDNIYNTYIKQAGAFEQLRLILKTIDGNRTNSLTDAEKRIDDSYSSAYEQLVSKAQLPARSSRRYLTNERVKLLTRYTTNGKYRGELYALFFDENFKNKVEPLVSEQIIYGNKTFEEVRSEAEEAEEIWKEKQRPFREEIKWINIGCILSLIWFILAMRLEVRKSKPQKDLFSLYVGQRYYKLHSFTGEVISEQSTIESGSTVYGNNQAGYRVANYRYEHDKFFVKGNDGQEHAVHLVDSGIRVRRGNIVSALWAIRKGKQSGSYIFFYNHDTKEETIIRKKINKIFHFSLTAVIPFAGLVYTLPMVLFHYGSNVINELITDPNSWGAVLVSSFFPLKLNISLLFISVTFFLLIRYIIQSSRKRNFLTVQLPKLFSVVKERVVS